MVEIHGLDIVKLEKFELDKPASKVIVIELDEDTTMASSLKQLQEDLIKFGCECTAKRREGILTLTCGCK